MLKYKLNFFVFLCRLSSVIHFSQFGPRVHQLGQVSFLYTIRIFTLFGCPIPLSLRKR